MRAKDFLRGMGRIGFPVMAAVFAVCLGSSPAMAATPGTPGVLGASTTPAAQVAPAVPGKPPVRHRTVSAKECRATHGRVVGPRNHLVCRGGKFNGVDVR